jgi:hypothetical protein
MQLDVRFELLSKCWMHVASADEIADASAGFEPGYYLQMTRPLTEHDLKFRHLFVSLGGSVVDTAPHDNSNPDENLPGCLCGDVYGIEDYEWDAESKCVTMGDDTQFCESIGAYVHPGKCVSMVFQYVSEKSDLPPKRDQSAKFAQLLDAFRAENPAFE